MDAYPVRNAMMQFMTMHSGRAWQALMKKGVTGDEGILLQQETKLSSNTEFVALAAGKVTRYAMDVYLDLIRPVLVGGAYALLPYAERPWLTSTELKQVKFLWKK
jgi:hypothetical protein